MKACPCGATPIVNRSLRSGSSIWCPECRKTLTKEEHAFSEGDRAIIEWVHGADKLPPICPFCKIPPSIEKAETETPTIVCRMAFCPLRDREFAIEEWNKARPEAYEFERLVGRWEKDPKLEKARHALKRAIRQHKLGRW